MKNFKKLILAATLAVTASFAQASVVDHTSGNYGVTYLGQDYEYYSSSDFDYARFSFASEYADKIVVAGSSGYLHAHGAPVSALLDVFDGKTWVNVFTSTPTYYESLASIFANPVEFKGMNISGLRLSSSAYVDQAFHGVASDTTYTLSGTPAEVPEPGTMLLLGLGMAGVVAMRRKSA